MKYIKIISYFFTKLSMNALSLFLMYQKKKYDILYIHKFSNKPTINSIYIVEYYQKLGLNVKEIFVEENSVKNYYLEMYHGIASKVIIVDSFSVVMSNVLYFKKQPVIQIWHSLGAIKTFGYQTIGKKEGRDELVAKHMNMHANYSCVITSGNASIKAYQEAFAFDNIICAKTPLIDYANDLKAVKNDKPTVLYIPTFRRTKDDGFKDIVEAFDFDKYDLMYQPHKSQENSFDNMMYSNVKIYHNQTSMDLINMADIVITDYSAVVFEAALLSKPIYYYLYDYNEYSTHNGLNFKIDELPGKVYYDVNSLIENLSTNKINYDQFIANYLTSDKTIYDVIDSYLNK